MSLVILITDKMLFSVHLKKNDYTESRTNPFHKHWTVRLRTDSRAFMLMHEAYAVFYSSAGVAIF